jgi:hypothetical protein
VSLDLADEVPKGIVLLHREKHAAYGNAWKRRGEIISILCNIARKVDRLQSSLSGAPDMRGEARLDTVVDPLVYCLKYETFLADLNQQIACELFRDCEHLSCPYSDNPACVDVLLERIDMTDLRSSTATVQDATTEVIGGFADVLECIPTGQPILESNVRFARVRALAERSISLIGALRNENAAVFDAFVTQLTKGI